MNPVVKVLNGSCSVVPCPKVWNMQRITWLMKNHRLSSHIDFKLENPILP